MTDTPTYEQFRAHLVAGRVRELTDVERECFTEASPRALWVADDADQSDEAYCFILDVSEDGDALLQAYRPDTDGGWYFSAGEFLPY